MNKKIWTEEEDAYIIENFGNITLTEMSKKLNCAIKTVQNRAIELSLNVEMKTNRRWTSEEIDLFRMMAPRYLNKTIAKKLGRSVNEINKKARSLNIPLIFKRPVWKKWKIKYLKENIDKLSLSQLQKELEVNYYQLMDKIDELGLEYNNNFWSEEEKNILTELCTKVYIRQISKVLNRTESAVVMKARHMGLDFITLKKEFSEEEIKYIKDNWGKKPINEIARILGVSRVMVQTQADKIGLAKLGNNPYRKWTPEEIDTLRKLASKKSISQLAKYFKTTNEAISTVAYKNGIVLKDSKIHWTESDNAQLIEFSKTLTLSEISNKMNRSSSSIRKQAARLNIELISNEQSRNEWTNEDDKCLRRLVQEGKSLLEICKIMSKKDETVLKKAKKLNLTILEDVYIEWTQEEIEKLKQYCKEKTISQLVIIFNRTTKDIKNMAKKLNINLKTDIKRWTEDEYKLLEKLTMIDKKSPKEIAEILERSEDSVILKINRRGLRVQSSEKKFWTKQEETLLQDLWGTESFESIAKKLNRTVSSIRNKAFQLGLGAAIENNYEGLTISYISQLFGVNITTVGVGWIALGLKYKVQKVTNSKSYRYVEINDLWNFLEKNQNIWDSKNLEKNILGKEPEWLKIKRKQDESGNSQIERLNIIKQQLILSDCFSLQCETKDFIESDEKAKTLVKKGESSKR